jgi:hypothetical protein
MKLIDILKENISEVVPTASNKYINRGRLNKQAVADYLKSVIDPSELKSVNAFMRDEEGWGESSSYFFDSPDEDLEPTEQEVEDWAKQEMSYYLFSSPDEFPSK